MPVAGQTRSDKTFLLAGFCSTFYFLLLLLFPLLSALTLLFRPF